MKEKLGDIVHKMRTSYSVIETFIKHASVSDKDNEEYTEIAKSSLKKMRQSIEELEDLVRIPG